MPELNNNTIRLMADASTELLARLEADRADLAAKLAAIDEKIANQKRIIGELNKLKGDFNSMTQGGERRPRGANRETIRALFLQKPNVAMTVQEIMNETSMPRSSVQAALAQMKDLELGEDRRWRLKPKQPSKEDRVATEE